MLFRSDSRTEKDIQAALRQVSANRTTLIVAHRLSTVTHADEILVLEGGRIVERGRHSELLAKNGIYAAMWSRQQEAEHLKEIARDLGEPSSVRRLHGDEPLLAGEGAGDL